MEFKRFFLEEVCTLITDGSHSSPKAVESGYKMLSVKDMGKFDFNYENAKQISEEDYIKLVNGNCQPLKNDVLIAKDGNSCLESCFVFRENKDVVLLSSIAILRPNTELINPYYLMYYLGTEKAKKELREGYLSGSAIPRVVLKDFKKYPLYLPSIDIQNKIVHIISLLISKIENNHSMIQNLEELSSTLFKRWFIDFEFPNEKGSPYQSSGGEMVENELGAIPKGWSVSTVNELGEIVGGGTPSKKQEEYYTVDGIPWITPKDLSSNKSKFIYKGNQDISELGLAKSSAKLMPKGTVLLSSRAPIGYLAIAGTDVTTNQGFKSIVPNKGYSEYFIYFKLKEMLTTIEANAGGSTFKEISASGLKAIQIVLPNKEVVNKFNETVNPLFEKIKNLELQMGNLVSLRDSLLPKLLSGEIEIPDESVVEPS